MSIRLGLNRLLVASMRRALRAVVRFRCVPENPDAIGIDRSRPVCYALHVRQLSAFVVLDDAARQCGLPLPSAPLVAEGAREGSSFFFLTRSGQPSPLSRNPYRYSKRLERLIAAVRSEPALDVQVVPVSVFWGRAPGRDDSVVAALFADSWVTPGFVRQFLRVLIHGRETQVSFGEPFSLREAIAQAPAQSAGASPSASDPATRRVARLLRATFRKDRELAVGPNLSHRQTLLNDVIQSEAVQRAIADEATRLGIDTARAELRARRFAYEIASDYSYPYIRAYKRALDAFWNRVYDGIEVHRFEDIALAGAGAEIVYLPCHRSHVDYLVLSYVIHQRGLSPPHVAAGINLNMPLVGSLLRRGGAFFLRRSFKGEPLFGAVFREYLHTIIQRGFPIEYFVEGGRSRTGRMLAPKAGILAMTVESYLREQSRPVVFVPVWIGYEQLVEGESYAAELAGAAKPRETLSGLLRALKDLRSRRFGKLHLNIGEPVRLAEFLDLRWPRWREEGGEADPGAQESRRRIVAALAREVVVRINDALVVNPVNLLACAVAGATRPAIDARELVRRVDLLRSLLSAQPVSERQVLTGMDGDAVVRYAQRLRIVERVDDAYGELVSVPAKQARQLGYFANNVLHALALPSLLACVLIRRPGIDRATLLRITAGLHPLLSAELFVGWSEQELGERIDALMAEFERDGLATASRGEWQPPPPGRSETALLESLARIVRPGLERYLLAVEVLTHAGSGAIGVAELLERCQRLARRLALTQEGTVPDFADRGSFATIVQTLLETGLASEKDDRLAFGEALEHAGREADGLLPEALVLTIASAARLAPGATLS
jgi:glycerol-3-phosphate O-acyltransferase